MQSSALIGHPLGHSFSPQIHARLFALEGIDARYELTDVAPEDLTAQMPLLRRHLRAFNVTIPHKRAVIPLIDSLTENARLYGAVNSVSIDSDGHTEGDNTDCNGFLRAMQAANIALETSVCVLGAGGVGRMFAIECARRGALVTIAVRETSLDKAQTLASEIETLCGKRPRTCALSELCGHYGLVINGTPVGMYPKIDACPVSGDFLAGVDAVFDCVYNPSETLLLARARAYGKKTAGGMAMLVWQAAAAHEIWYGASFRPEDMAQLTQEAAEEMERRFREEGK